MVASFAETLTSNTHPGILCSVTSPNASRLIRLQTAIFMRIPASCALVPRLPFPVPGSPSPFVHLATSNFLVPVQTFCEHFFKIFPVWLRFVAQLYMRTGPTLCRLHLCLIILVTYATFSKKLECLLSPCQSFCYFSVI